MNISTILGNAKNAVRHPIRTAVSLQQAYIGAGSKAVQTYLYGDEKVLPARLQNKISARLAKMATPMFRAGVAAGLILAAGTGYGMWAGIRVGKTLESHHTTLSAVIHQHGSNSIGNAGQ